MANRLSHKFGTAGVVAGLQIQRNLLEAVIRSSRASSTDTASIDDTASSSFYEMLVADVTRSLVAGLQIRVTHTSTGARETENEAKSNFNNHLVVTRYLSALTTLLPHAEVGLC